MLISRLKTWSVAVTLVALDVMGAFLELLGVTGSRKVLSLEAITTQVK